MKRLVIEIEDGTYRQIRKQLGTAWAVQVATVGDPEIVRATSLGAVLGFAGVIVNAIDRGHPKIGIVGRKDKKAKLTTEDTEDTEGEGVTGP